MLLRRQKTIILVAIMLATTFSASPVWASKYQTTTVTYPYYGFVEDPEHPWETEYSAQEETGTIEYSDEFFDEPSPGDHPELRVASYAVALAGFENQADGGEFDSLNPNPKLIGLLNQLGFSDYKFWDEASEDEGESMGTTIGHKTLPSGQELIVIAPRNYNYMTEWLSNFNVGTSGDHNGFLYSANLIKDRFDEYLGEHDFEDYKLWAVGYSRGGAVIDLFAKLINQNLSDYKMASDDFYAYTFGAPRASLEETKFENIHDVKDGNDLLLGYVFPELWGFYNTGVYEEIHPADIDIPTSVVDISDLADSSKIASVLISNQGVTEQVGTMNGRDFMDSWLSFVNDNGLTREYFDSEVKEPLSKIMKAYQKRHLDEQSEFTGFFTDMNGLAGQVAYSALQDLEKNYNYDISIYPVYLDLVDILQGNADGDIINRFVDKLKEYMGEYSDYEVIAGGEPAIKDYEFETIKENLPKLVKALGPLIVADAAYTQETYGENHSLFYTYTLVSNAENLVVGHIPESMMKNLKELIVNDEPEPEPEPEPQSDSSQDLKVPNSGTEEYTTKQSVSKDNILDVAIIIVSVMMAVAFTLFRRTRKNQRA